MAGPQASSQGRSKFGDRYPVPNHNKPVSTVYFNEVKAYAQEKYHKQLTQWVAFLTEPVLYRMLRDEMDKYTFGFPDNQCRWFFAMLEEKYHEHEKESGAEVRNQVQQSKEDSKQEAKAEKSQSQAQEE